MKKVYKLEDLDCANCAAKMECAIKKLDGVNDATVSFMAQRLTIEADDDKFEEIMDNVQKVCRKIEPDCTILPLNAKRYAILVRIDKQANDLS